MSWTEEKVEKLKELWGKGNTASQIAEIIGGISRNAVIGKAHRLNLSAKIKQRSPVPNQISNTKFHSTNINIWRRLWVFNILIRQNYIKKMLYITFCKCLLLNF